MNVLERQPQAAAPTSDRRRFGPVATIVALALVQQLVVGALAGTSPRGGASSGLSPIGVDARRQPLLRIPLLEASFLRRTFANVVSVPVPTQPPRTGTTNRAPAGSGHVAKPSKKIAPTAVPGSANLEALFRPTTSTVHPGDLFAYQLVLRNTGGRAAGGSFTISTHAPRGTLVCDPLLAPLETVGVSECLVAGSYDGTANAQDSIHIYPAPQTAIVTVPAGAEQVIFTLTLQVLPALPDGTVFNNHAHLSMIGSASVVLNAPDVVVSAPLPGTPGGQPVLPAGALP